MSGKTAIYARQSIDKKDSVSIEAQIDECKRLCGMAEIVAVYEDRGFSGKNTNRPQLQKLIADITLGKIQKVLVYKLDRISRNITDFFNLYEQMQKCHCEFASATENFDTSTTAGRGMMGLLAVFAEMERENIQQRVKDNYYYRIHDGRWAGGPAPFGFRNIRLCGFPTLEPVKEEIVIVKKVFHLYTVEYESLYKVADRLNAQGYKTRNGMLFNNVSVRRILKNPVYVKADKALYMYLKNSGADIINTQEEFNGEYSCCLVGKSTAKSETKSPSLSLKGQTAYLTKIEGVVSSSQYITAQALLKENKQIAGSGRDTAVLRELSGKLKCSSCGYAIKAYGYKNAQKKIPYLYCYGNKSQKSCNIKFHGLDFTEIQKEIAIRIQQQINTLESLEKGEKEIIGEKQKRISAIEDAVDRLLQLVIDGSVSKSVKEKIQDLENQKNALELELEVCRTALLQSDFLPKSTSTTAKPVYEQMSPIQKKKTVQLLIDKILVFPDNSLTVMWKL